MTTTYDADPDAHTIVAAWASSALGEPDGDVRPGLAAADQLEPARDLTPPTKWALLAAALATGIIGGAGLGAMLDYDDQSGATFVPAPDAPAHAVVVSPSVPASKPAAQEWPDTQPTVSSAPKPVVSEQLPGPTPELQPAPAAGPQQVPANPNGASPPVVIDMPVPNYAPLPDTPDQQDPQPPKDPDPADPKPEPPVADEPTSFSPEPLTPQVESNPTVVTGRFTSPINGGNPDSSNKRRTDSDQPKRTNSLNP